MSVPSDQLMQLVNGGMKGPPQAAPMQGAPQGTPGANAPVSAPMSTPDAKQGDKQKAMVSISLAGDLLEQTLPALGSETEEGGVIIDILSKLNKKFGTEARKAHDLVPAELMHMMQNLPQAGGASPEMKALMGGGAPQGMPQGGPPKPPIMPPAAAMQ